MIPVSIVSVFFLVTQQRGSQWLDKRVFDGSVVLALCCFQRLVLNGRCTKCCLHFALCKIALLISHHWWGLLIGNCNVGKALEQELLSLQQKAAKHVWEISLAQCCVCQQCSLSVRRAEQRWTACCLPTGSLSGSSVSRNSSGAAPWSGIWAAQPQGLHSCPALCALYCCSWFPHLFKEKQLEALSPGDVICILCLIKAWQFMPEDFTMGNGMFFAKYWDFIEAWKLGSGVFYL